LPSGGTSRRICSYEISHTAVSGILILAAFLGLTGLSGSSTFDYNSIITAGLPLTTQLILLTMLLVGFGIKIPLVLYIPGCQMPTLKLPPVAILLGGVMAKLGTYGLVRFG